MNKKLSFLAVISTLFISILFSAMLAMPAFATTYLEAYASGIVQPGNNITISGLIVNTSTSDTIAGINVSAAAASGGNGSGLSGATGTFNFNITAPSTVGSCDVTVTSVNESTPHTKVMPIYVSNATGGSVAYTSNSPPFSAGDAFIINVTLLNETNSSDIRRVGSWMDCDFSMPPEIIPKLIDSLKDYDVAIGSRYVKGGKDNRTFVRILTSKIINLLACIFLDVGIKDYTTGFVAAKRRVLDKVKFLPKGHGEYCIEFLYKCSKGGFRIKEIPYSFVDRKRGNSKTSAVSTFTISKFRSSSLYFVMSLSISLSLFPLCTKAQ